MSWQRVGWMAQAGVALASGLGLWWAFAPDEAQRQQLDEEVNAMAQRLQPADALAPDVAASVAAEAARWPAQSDGVAVWTALQQGLQAWGLHVQDLRPQALDMVNELPEQVVVLRLQGRWADWRAFDRAMAVQAPWWLAIHGQVTPSGQGADDVRIELQARVGWRPQGLTQPIAWHWHAPVPDGRAPTNDPPMFYTGPGGAGVLGPARAASMAGPGASPLPPHPLRLMGVWQQGEQAHALLAQDQTRWRVVAGQSVGHEGYRVRRVGAAEVELTPPNPALPVLRLRLQEKP